MSQVNAVEVLKFFHSYGVKCDLELIDEWIKDDMTSLNNPVNEGDLYAFNDWVRCKGTFYESGIDDQTKIERLLDEIKELRKENKILKETIFKLEC